MNVQEMRRRGNARTNYDPEEFIEAFESAESLKERDELREVLGRIDGGRFYEFLDSAHNVLAHSDLKRRDAFVENYSDHLILWIKAFGAAEDLTTFPNVEV